MSSDVRFASRRDAGRVLAHALKPLRAHRPVVLGLARGGVPVAHEVAQALAAPLAVVHALKLHVPGQPEVAAGAVAEGVRYFVDDVVNELEISSEYLAAAAEALEAELAARLRSFGQRAAPALRGRHVIVVDDGVASGATAAAAIQSARLAGASRVIFAAPVASRRSLECLRIADEVVVPMVSPAFHAVSDFYADFTQLSDNDVRALLTAHA